MALALLLSLATLAAQTDTASDAGVRRTIEQHYFKAHATGNGSFLRGVFVEEGRMFWAADGRLRSRTSTDYINGFIGQPASDESQRKRRILAVDVTGDVAFAKAELDYPEARLVDYFILVRASDGWRIVSKAFQRFPKNPA
jgi:hypothetical protein